MTILTIFLAILILPAALLLIVDLFIKKEYAQTNVVWGFTGLNKYPMNIMFTLPGLNKTLAKICKRVS